MMSPIEESKTAMCLSPHEKLKGVQRNKRSLTSGPGPSDKKKARLDDMFKNEFELDLDGWISDDYLRAMDFDDRLNHDIDWVAHDEMDLALSMDALAPSSDDVNDFGFGPSFLRGGLALDDPVEMASTFVDPAYIRLESSNAKDAEKLLMSFDTMNFKIPSPTSKKRSSISEKKVQVKQEDAKSAAVSGVFVASSSAQLAANSAAAEELRKEQARVSAATVSLSISASTDSLLSILNVSSPTSNSNEKKIGSYSPAARKLRLQKFHEKRKNRTWKKSIKYDCRKKLADDRPRIKGRFVRVLENDSKPVGASPPASAGYASPTSPTGAMAPPMMAKAAMPRVAASYGSTRASGAKQTPVVAVVKTSPVPAQATSSLPFARMIASV